MDINLILQTTNQIYRYAKTQDKRLPIALREFYQEGIKNPGVAQHLGYLNYGKYLANEGRYLKDPMARYMQGSSYIFEQLKALMLIPSRIRKVLKTNEELKNLKAAFDNKFLELYYTTGAKKREKIMLMQMKTLRDSSIE